MKNMLRRTLGLLVVGTLTTVASGPTQAASGVGPYYAIPSWDQTLPASTRFIVLTNMASQAVLDRETGLVWEQAPDAERRDWGLAQRYCNTKTVGGRLGWRLATIQELASLVDPANNTGANPVLPAGHPFSNIVYLPFTFPYYWSATTNVDFATDAWTVRFDDARVTPVAKMSSAFVWCVRGGQGQ